ncbi:MAG: YceI family protein [Actinomycetota bacterium]|nr:YceI family protein [Actinomycetota bacterium]
MTTSTSTIAAGTWNADTVHSDVSFKVRHMAVGRVRGNFELTSATLTVGEDGIPGASVMAVIDATSVETKSEQRNQHIKSADFLHVEKHSTIEFTSTGVRDFDGENFIVVGDLTVHGVSNPVELATEFLGATTDAYGKERAGFSATTSISRAAFGVDIQLAFGAGNAVVADKIDIALELELVLDTGE